ncbi:hypothetical protein F4861DRAFT_212334 [Xylaria intraflava]|nr:hypothetical protein F4861DRAFT_212334 [Xylaria intraflava]
MGWLWSSGPEPKQTKPTNPTTATPPNPNSEPHQPEPHAQEQPADPEITKFLTQVQAELRTPTQPNPSTPQNPSQSQPQAPRLDPLSESLLPTTMSCRQHFDQAFHCNSLGGQWTAVYRSGTIRSCSEHWDDFWFCMRTRAYTGEAKETAIRDHHRRRELTRYGPGMPSSTDVWEPRTERLPADSVFRGRYVPPEVSDEEWRRQEIERRKAILRMMREEDEKGAGASS